MINEQILIDTVQRMLDAGIDDPTIISTLVDTGLSQEDATAVVAKTKAPKDAPIQAQAPPQQDIQLMKSQIEVQAQTQELNDTAVHNKLDLHEQKIDEVSKKIDEVKDAVTTTTSTQKDSSLEYRLSTLEQKLEEVNSVSKATLDIMKNILETDRKILTELEAKK